MHLPIIWIERISLLQVYLSHFIVKQDTRFKDICFKQVTQVCSACSSIGLIYYGPANLSFRSQIPCANYFLNIIYYEVFLYFFFRINFLIFFFFFFFCVLAQENQEAFSESCSLISGALQGLVKICKKYMEVNNFLLLICCPEKLTFGRITL